MKRFGSLRRTKRLKDEELHTRTQQSESSCLSGMLLMYIEDSARDNIIDICLVVTFSSLAVYYYDWQQPLTVSHQILEIGCLGIY